MKSDTKTNGIKSYDYLPNGEMYLYHSVGESRL